MRERGGWGKAGREYDSQSRGRRRREGG